MSIEFQRKEARVLYLLPDVGKPVFDLRPFLKSIRDLEVISYIRSNWIRSNKPIGGVKVYYQHCMLLREQGIDANVLRLGKYDGNFFEYDESLSISYNDNNFQLKSTDIIVFPEWFAFESHKFPLLKKILFVQSYRHLYKYFGNSPDIYDYAGLGFEHVLCCSDLLMESMNESSISVDLVPNFIDHTKFFVDSSKTVKGRILAMPRKNPDVLKEIIRKVSKYGIEITLVDNLSEAELIHEYQCSDIFVATGYPEGFGLPPLEAMACGCVVVGFTGGGANEFMVDNETAWVVDDGDVDGVVNILLKKVLDETAKERIRKCGVEISKKYRKDNTALELVKVFTKYIDS